jgi:hypothetical protein
LSSLNAALEEPQLPNLLREQIDYSEYTFLFQSEPDACADCRAFHGMELTVEEIEFLFGDYLKKNLRIWYPNVHPHCRCLLILYRRIEEMIVEMVLIVEMPFERQHHAHAFKGGEEVKELRWVLNSSLN